jgi:hypothetical protein
VLALSQLSRDVEKREDKRLHLYSAPFSGIPKQLCQRACRKRRPNSPWRLSSPITLCFYKLLL